MFKTFKEFVLEKGHTEEAFKALEVADKAKLDKEYQAYYKSEMAKALEAKASKEDIQSMIDKSLEKMENKTPEVTVAAMEEYKGDVASLEKTLKEQGVTITQLKLDAKSGNGSLEDQVSKLLKENADAIGKAGTGEVVKIVVKADVTTGSVSNLDVAPILNGIAQTPPSNVRFRRGVAWGLTNMVNTNQAVYPYIESIPKDGDYSFVAEGAEKPEIDFEFRKSFASPKKVAAWTRLTLEALQDIPNLDSIARGYLRDKHDRFRDKAILKGDGVGENATGVFTVARTFNAGAMANSIANPNIMHVVNAAMTDIYTTHNYEDEIEYLPTLVMMNPIDFFIEFNAAVDGDGRALYPSATLYNQVTIGGLTIVPDSDVDQGKIFVGDMSKYNTTNYMEFVIMIGRINDDFITNKLVMLGESRFHAFVKELDKFAFIYDDIETIRTSITE